ncbi:hypothetical protein RHSP_31740 [Rhizobium freirei PRF 81]|uniref:Uncharacterized protein n=1 Tax=Rhizobium freirei PRF 81 TaxID=363754 RepID=N6V4U7_9HYPH|nr:DUF2441 domain-containing protein [Rhizobium freirei]ENN86037.1 hypothetical protein RHSP_31740 [Rhizobium freirei PRF 81]
MKISPLYHCAPLRLGIGSVIEVGNWGRLIRSMYQTGQTDGTSKIVFEMAYEAMRLACNPSAPSRLNCVFCCPTLDEAKKYWEANARANIIYKVCPVDPSCSMHVTSWAFYGFGNGLNYTAAEQRVRAYWTETPIDQLEVLVGGSVRVEEVLS